ncbi:MAG: 2-hydroxychromene-2-carboxylate isomerase [Motiliproteus sp.]|nr:2-hydroxychromene-2-carboxylate isomerase [Motiliproteus sp.]MCW9051059.1 2-hydroxychromene-2-carboxylate isomerase [Motiliproteus sp.]
MSTTIEFYYDVLSPYAYIAFRRLPGMAKRLNAELQLHPVSLPKILELADNTPPVQVPSRLAYIKKDVPALARYYGIPLNWASRFPSRTGRAMSVLCCVEGEQRKELSRKLFDAYWIEGMDLGDEETLVSLVGEDLVEQASQESVRQQLDESTAKVVERGAFGVPTCFVGDEMFFGNDRLFMLQVYLNQE